MPSIITTTAASNSSTSPLASHVSTRKSPFVVARGALKHPHPHHNKFKQSPTRRPQTFADLSARPPPAAPSAMAFYRSKTQAELVANLRTAGVVRSDAVIDTMLATDRAKYMAQGETPDGGHVGELDCYADSPHPIGFHQTISAPHMHAHALELAYETVKDVNHPRILDVGAGSGYLTASFGRLVEQQHGRVFGIEIVSGLAQFAMKNVQSAAPELLDSGVVSVHCCNGWDGLPNEAPFHFIHVGGATDEPPQALMDQLADGGRLVIPLDEERGGQMLVEITRNGNSFSQRKLMGVCYVPLVRGRKPSV